MKKYWDRLLTLAALSILCSFLSLLILASIGGRSDGRKIPFPAVLGESGCYVSGCHMTSGNTLNEVGSLAFDSQPTSFIPGET